MDPHNLPGFGPENKVPNVEIIHYDKSKSNQTNFNWTYGVTVHFLKLPQSSLKTNVVHLKEYLKVSINVSSPVNSEKRVLLFVDISSCNDIKQVKTRRYSF